MPGAPKPLAVTGSLVGLLTELVDFESPSGSEAGLSDAMEATLTGAKHLEVIRFGNTVAARTKLGRPTRVVWAGHIDTVPANNNLPSTIRDGWLWGRGSVDMKGGVAMGLRAAVLSPEPIHDVTWIFYDNEEVEAEKNGLGLFGAAHPDWVVGDFAIVGEPSNGVVEGGCNGTLRVQISTQGVRAHSARAWMGHNAIHDAADILSRLQSYQPRTVTVDGLDYREGLNAVGISGGVAGNVIPDSCTVTVNYRFAPDKTIDEAVAHLADLFTGYHMAVVDQASGARPGVDQPLVQEFVTALGVPVMPKYGWTDVSRFSDLGIPAVNFGPGDPSLAHTDDERVELSQVLDMYEALSGWLSGSS